MRKLTAYRSQRGVALIVGLIMLLAITILAIAGMHGARNELLMSGQTQRMQQVQNAANSGIDLRFAEAATFDTTWIASTAFDTVEFGSRREILVATAGQYVGTSPAPPGFSLNGQFTAHHFQITSNAGSNPAWDDAASNNDPMLGAQASQVQGFYIIGPGN